MQDPASLFPRFRTRLSDGDPLQNIRAGIIGRDALIDTPQGRKPLIYADFVASGRALRQVEETVMQEVLPWYANSHTEDSHCGAYMTALRRVARAEVARSCGADDDHAVIFTGSGATAGLNRLVHLLGLDRAIAQGHGATVLTGPYEHHSNILPWRESGAQVIEIPEAETGGPDLIALDAALAAARGLVIGTFSAASNVTGLLTDVAEVTRRLKAAGALAVWDYAGGGPYLPITMSPAPDAPIDAIALSPHKFVGGPGASGVLILRRDAVATAVPTCPGGGSVRFVSPWGHDYAQDVEEREEAGTPNILGDIRAALALSVKDAAGPDRIARIEHRHAARALTALRDMPGITLLGHATAARLPILSFRVHGPAGDIDPNAATRLLSDHFGLQARGGCACAGPYGHRLLGIDADSSARMRDRMLAGDTTARPGFVRVGLNYLFDDAECAVILDAIRALPNLSQPDAPRQTA